MAAVVVDTDVVSLLFKNDTRADLYRAHLDEKIQIVSFMTIAELSFWSLVKGWSDGRKQRMAHHLRRFAVHPYNSVLCRIWAEVRFAARKSGTQISREDAWVAATTIRHRLPLVTHNKADYVGVPDLVVISEA